jgi:hypothetical protein
MKQPFLFLCICGYLCVAVTSVGQSAPPRSARMVKSYGQLPLAFEVNRGQTDPTVKFLSRGLGYDLFLTATEAVLDLRPATTEAPAASKASLAHINRIGSPPRKNLNQRRSDILVLRMKLLGANPKAAVTGQDELPGKSNYFIGNDPGNWHTNVRQFAKVCYENVYPGVNLVYYGQKRELEYDFLLQPGASPQVIRLRIEGARRLQLVRGDLVLKNAGGDVHLRAPHIYQELNGVRHQVRGGYVMKGKNEVGFEVEPYDRRRALVIDPVLAYSTYLGGSGSDLYPAIAVDSSGNAYVTGQTNSGDFPTANAIQPVIHGSDAFVTKINRDGTALVYSTYLGGSGGDGAASIAVDRGGNAYITGTTESGDFPSVNAIQPEFGGAGDAFVAKINAAGSALVYSTYLGGSNYDWGLSIAVDAASIAYVTGMTNSADFPTLNAIQGTYGGNGFDYAAFVTKVGSAGNLIYSTYLGGSKENEGHGIRWTHQAMPT